MITHKTFGILPMAGRGSRIQPIGFSKELYPTIHKGRHYAISEFTIMAMKKAGVDEIKIVTSPSKKDIADYYSQSNYNPISIYFFDSPSLPESCLFPIDGLHDNDICLFGLPDTLFFPSNGFKKVKQSILDGADITLGLFQVDDGSLYDSVLLDKDNNVKKVLVKKKPPLSNLIWGIWGAKVGTLKKLRTIINRQKANGEKLLGTGFNRLADHKEIKFKGVHVGKKYFDIGTMDNIIRINSLIKNFRF